MSRRNSPPSALSLSTATGAPLRFPIETTPSGDAMLANVKTKSRTAKKQSPKKPNHAGRYSVPVVRSTFRVLEELAKNGLLGLNDITRSTGISKSTVFRILNTLQEMG